VPVPAIAFVVDALVVLVFAAVGRRSHAESAAVTGVLVTAWPFFTGLTLGWAGFAAAHRRPPLTPRDAVGLWVPTVAIGMLLRQLTGKGTALSFVVVATLFLGAGLLGWRAVAQRYRPS
jgi:Protein of unknown function (DUF3054)